MPEMRQQDCLVPILIGVTGHRDSGETEVPVLEGKVRALIGELIAKHPNSPIKILSSLAEGADRLVARVGLDMGLGLTAVLPMPRAEYENDFSSEGSRGEFSAFLNRAEQIIELPLLDGALEGICARKRQYAQAGAYIVAHSQVLVALWDGVEGDDEAGTSAVVRFQLEGVPAPYAPTRSPLDQPESGPVYHILTTRGGAGSQRNQADGGRSYLIKKSRDWNVLYPAFWGVELSTAEAVEKADDYYASVLAKIDCFNRDAGALKDDNAIKTSMSYVIPEDKQAGLSPGMRRLLGLYGLADVLAIRYQGLTVRMLRLLLTASVAGFFFFGVFDTIWTKAYVLALFPAMFGLGFALYRLASKRDWENKFYEYRALAEGLRVQMFWKLAGRGEGVPDHYLRKYRGEMDWVFEAIRGTSIKASHERPEESLDGKRAALGLVFKHWVEDQRKFFERRSGQKMRALKKQGRLTVFFFLIAMAMVMGLLLMKASAVVGQGSFTDAMDMEDIQERRVYLVVVVLVDALIAVGAALTVYMEMRSFSDEVKQYQRMASLFRRGSRAMVKCLSMGDLDGAGKLVVELGKEALIENGDWLMLQRSRPLEMPLG